MRILQMISSMAVSGGAEMLVRNLALHYARQGHACHIVYISGAAGLNASEEYERAFKAQMDEAGVTYEGLGHECRRNLPLGAWRFRRAVRRFRPDVVHMHLGYGLLFQAIAMVRTPTVYTNHNIVFRFPAGLFRLFDRFVDRYVAICRACETLLRGHVRKPVALIYNGVPADFSDAPVRLEPARDFKVLSVGDLTPQKDYPTLIAAAARIAPDLEARGRSVTFDVAGGAGGCDERPLLERLIRERGLEGGLRLLGTRGDVPRLMAEADLLVLASRYEGLPITLIEAAMSALPAVATDVGGSGDVVLDGVTGTLVPPGSPEAVAEAVIALATDRERYARYSAAAREHGRRFTLDACAEAHLALFADLIAARRPSRIPTAASAAAS